MNASNRPGIWCLACAVPLVALVAACTTPQVADQVFTGGAIYTADPDQRVVPALAIKDDRIVYVGANEGASELIGKRTQVHRLDGAMILPGLHDMHIHALAMVPRDGCDLDSEPMTLAELATFIADCIEDQELAEGDWLGVVQWSFSTGNQPDETLKTIRQALDLGAPRNPVLLWGNDGHHGAANSLALAQARNAEGEVVGISRATLATDFAEYRETIGVDAQGEPNGSINETARDLIPRPSGLFGSPSPDAVQQVGEILASRGITSIMDARMPRAQLKRFKSLAERSELTYNLAAALFLNPSHYINSDGTLDADTIIRELDETRSHYASTPQINANFAKVFVDGVLEGNPLAEPPTQPNAAVLEAYRQPRFHYDSETHDLEILGYVDPGSAACASVGESTPQQISGFHAEHGFFPAQCRQSRGVLEHDETVILDYMHALDEAGFNIHAHVIGDRAMRVVLDGLEALKGTDRASRHSLAHIQLVHPDDYRRIGNLGLSLVFTYAWITTHLAYDLKVIPYIDQVRDVGDLYREDGYYFNNAYPVAGLKQAGAVLAAGSDAPVDSRDPRPFVNIEQALTRAGEDGKALNATHAVGILDVLDAYTINGARLFGHDDQTGSIEVGKFADLTLIDQNLIHLANSGRADEISETQVLKTWYRGRSVFER